MKRKPNHNNLPRNYQLDGIGVISVCSVVGGDCEGETITGVVAKIAHDEPFTLDDPAVLM